PGEAHDFALKAAETDATKRALATFGKRFGLTLYGGGNIARLTRAPALAPTSHEVGHNNNFSRDGAARNPPPSSDYGSAQDLMSRDLAPRARTQDHAPAVGQQPSTDPSIVPPSADLPPGRIDKSVLTIAEPKRHRNKAHLKFVASQSCLVCGRRP